MKYPLLNFILFQTGWLLCVSQAGKGLFWVGPVTAALILPLHLRLCPNRAREVRFLSAACLLGMTADSFESASGLFSFKGGAWLGCIAPLWMAALWLLFASLFNSSLSWLKSYPLAAIFGAVGGPLTYYSGAKLGAIEIQGDPAASLGKIALAWALIMPALLWLREKTGRSS